MIGFPLRTVGGFLAFFLVGFVGALLYPHLIAWRTDSAAQPPIRLHGDPHCDPSRGGCVAHHEGMTLELSLPDSMRTMIPFDVAGTLNGPQAARITSVTVEFSMKGMYMGSNRFVLQQQDPTTWRGQAMLPICSNGRSDWQVTVEVGDNPTYLAEFATVVEP